MITPILRSSLAVLGLTLATAAWSDSPSGRWQTIDDETGKPKAILEIREDANGALSATILEILQSNDGPNPVCKQCEGERHNQPITGMTILWDLRPDGTNAWSSGTILDPANGKTYRAKAELQPGGQQLDVSGCILFICRSQHWQRLPGS